jgi:hypothetical protein
VERAILDHPHNQILGHLQHGLRHCHDLSYGRKQDAQYTIIFLGLKDVLGKKSSMNFMDKPVMAQELCI